MPKTGGRAGGAEETPCSVAVRGPQAKAEKYPSLAADSGSRLTANLKTMDGSPPGGRVLAVDHDRLFKELLTTFFFEFLDLFFPRLTAQMDRESIEFLSQELFPDLLDGAEYQADILVKARFKGQDAYFLIHVEHQSDAPATFPRRFFRYFSAIFSR